MSRPKPKVLLELTNKKWQSQQKAKDSKAESKKNQSLK